MEKYLVELLFDSLCTSLCIEKRQTVQSRETRSSQSKERLFDAEELKESGTNPERIHVVPSNGRRSNRSVEREVQLSTRPTEATRPSR